MHTTSFEPSDGHDTENAVTIMNGVAVKNVIELSEGIRTMSTRMMYISQLMQRGNISRAEIQMPQQRMHLTEKMIEVIQTETNSFTESDV